MRETFAERIEMRIQELREEHSRTADALNTARDQAAAFEVKHNAIGRQIDALAQAYTFERRQETK